MKFKTKLLLTFGAIGLLTNGISLALMYQLSHHYLFQGYRDKMLSVTASVATLLDAELLKTIQTPEDENTPAYSALRIALRNARDANQRPDTHMRRVFTVVPSKQNPKVLLIAVDPEESLQNSGHAGEVYRGANVGNLNINQAIAEEGFINDEFGTWLRAHAPVRDREGRVVGAVIVEAPIGWVESKMQPILLSGLAALLLAVGLTIPAVMAVSRRVTGPLLKLRDAVESIGKGSFETRLSETSGEEFNAVALSINHMAAGLAERERVKTAFARYVSHQVVDTILQSTSDIKLSGDRRMISVLFCDIRGFTTISETLAPEKVVQLLNEYFESMVEVVFRNGGTLDKFIGDGLMVIFGAPQDDPKQEEHALQAAIEMQAELRKLAEKWKPEGLNLRIGIGINSGPAIVGNIGSARRMDYTAIGDTVNLASRLESSTKELGVGILLSEYTYNALRGSYRFRSMGSVRVRGRSQAVETYSVEEADVVPLPDATLESVI